MLDQLHLDNRRRPRRDARGDRRGLRTGALRPPDPRGCAPAPRARLAGGPARAGGLRAPARARRTQRERRGRDFLPGSRHVRPLRPGADRHADGALGVPDPLHALPARDLPGRPAGHVRVPDRDLRADRAGGRQRLGLRRAERGRRGRVPRQAAQRPRAVRGQRRSAPAHAADAAHLRARLRRRGRRGASAGRPHRPRCVDRRDRRGHHRGDLRPAEPLRRRRGRARAQRRREAPGRPRRDRAGRPDRARRPRGAGRMRRRRRRRRGPAARQPPRLRRAVVRLLRGARGVPAADARADRRRDARRRRAPRVRADAADPRAAHPPREGDLEHLHRAGAERARRRRLPRVARPPRDRRARRAAARAHALRARDARRTGGRRAAARPAGRARVRAAPDAPGGEAPLDVAAVKRRCAAQGVNPGVDLHALTGRDADRGGLLVALTERRDRADIDRLAEVLGAAVAAERGAASAGRAPADRPERAVPA